jgi:hypothetical protein
MPNLHVLRYKTHGAIDLILNDKFDSILYWEGTASERKENLHEFLHFLVDTTTSAHRLTVQRHDGHLYTNDAKLIDAVTQFDYITETVSTQVEIGAAGTLELKNPQHAYRTYFKNQRIDITDKQRLANFIFNYPDVRVGPGLNLFLTQWPRDTRLMQNYFIDHNDMGLITMLQLVCPATCKKTLKLIKR